MYGGVAYGSMGWLIAKYLITAAVVVAVSELARRSDKLGALVAALPLVTVLALLPAACFWVFATGLRRFGIDLL